MDQLREETFVRTFIHPDSQERYLMLLANPKRRHKALNSFWHKLPIGLGRSMTIAPRDHFPEDVGKLLREKGAGSTCYLISPEPDLDQRELPLAEALHRLIMEDGCGVACCIPGRLAYFKEERAGTILEIPATRSGAKRQKGEGRARASGAGDGRASRPV